MIGIHTNQPGAVPTDVSSGFVEHPLPEPAPPPPKVDAYRGSESCRLCGAFVTGMNERAVGVCVNCIASSHERVTTIPRVRYANGADLGASAAERDESGPPPLI